jgi:chemotaxis protein histidine kinase CheA
MSENVKSEEQKILDNLRVKFIDSAREKLVALDLQVNALRTAFDPKGVEAICYEIHTLKGLGGTFGFNDMSQIAARMEDFIQVHTTATDQHLDELEFFLTGLSDCLDRKQRPAPAELDQILSELPRR